MNTVFIGGSRHISRLPEEAKERLQNITSAKHRIIIGDATGADTVVQKHLRAISYPSVTVYCSGERCRNNVGRWETKKVAVPKKENGFRFYAVKDREMAREADFGFMIWDGKSPGTLLNVLRLLLRGKKAVLLNTASKETKTFKALTDWNTFLARSDATLIESLRTRATPEEWCPPESPEQPSLLDVEGADSAPLRIDEATLDAINRAFDDTDSPVAIQHIGEIAKRYGMTQLAKNGRVARESLYRSLSRDGNPEFGTVLKIIRLFGLKLTVSKD